jgi:hypothetical protein
LTLAIFSFHAFKIDKEVHSLTTDEEEAGCHGSGTESDQDAKLDAKVSSFIFRELFGLERVFVSTVLSRAPFVSNAEYNFRLRITDCSLIPAMKINFYLISKLNVNEFLIGIYQSGHT